MKDKVLLLLLTIFIFSCSEEPKELPAETTKVKPVEFLPFQSIGLNNLDSFKESDGNWKVVGSAYVDRSKDQTITPEDGTGVLINLPEQDANGHLFTNFEHGDIEIELDVMMPKGSNSGLYFQGRYEVQLFDSWGIEKPRHSDMGGIYQRWDATKEKGKKGFEGFPPKINAAKAPGLWQHFKILFHAPKFDASGNKIKNALFEKVWLNGMLIQENIEVSGPTRAAVFEDEKPMGPLMVQGDHGPVALKNIQYKLYENKKVDLTDMVMIEYENATVELPDFDSLTPMREIKTDSISANMVSGERSQRILKYNGQMQIPDTGDYLFDYKVNGAGGLLLIDRDTIVNLDGDYNLDSLGIGKVALTKGAVPFTLIYNKHRPWTKGFSLEVEGPQIQKHGLQGQNSLDLNGGKPVERIMVEVDDRPVTQRSFLMHDGKKRTHCISVGMPEKLNYAYDLSAGTLLEVWDGDFLDATQMWHSRGPKQLGMPAGFTVSFHGDSGFAELDGKGLKWPDTSENPNYKSYGYEFDDEGIPFFSYGIAQSKVTDKMTPSGSGRGLERAITVTGEQEIWHKIAVGESIEKLPDGTFIINDESYFIDFSSKNNSSPTIRKSDSEDELLIKIPAGEQKLTYSIIW